MTGIRLEGDIRGLLRKTKALAEMDKKKLNRALAQGERSSTLERFDKGVGPDGKRWPTSKRAAVEGGKTLVDSAQLRNSIHSRSDASGFAVGTNAVHASTHQFGAKYRLIKAKNKKYLHFKVNGHWVRVKKVRVTIPPRPFLGLSEDDLQEIQETTEKFLQKLGE